MRGSPPKGRTGLTVFDWSGEIVADWLERGHGRMTDGLDLFPSERGTLVSETALNRRLNRYCDELGRSPGTIGHRQAKTVPLLGQDQRLAMLKACLTDDVDSLSYRIAATFLLLYAQPIVNIAATKSTDVIIPPDGLRLSAKETQHPSPNPCLVAHRTSGLAPQHAHRQHVRQRKAVPPLPAWAAHPPQHAHGASAGSSCATRTTSSVSSRTTVPHSSPPTRRS